MAVRTESSLSRAGGTAKYAPPDTNRSAPPTATDLIDRDVYGLGVTLYQVLTGRYPFPSGVPSLGETAADPRSDSRAERPVGRARGDAPEGHRPAARGQVRQRRGVPGRAPGDQRGAPQADARARGRRPAARAPARRTSTRSWLTCSPCTASRRPATPAPAGRTRYGTYVATALDENLIPDVLDGALPAGHHHGQRRRRQDRVPGAARRGGAPSAAGEPGPPRANGVDITLPGGRMLRTNNDGSQDEGDRANDDVLQRVLRPVRGRGRRQPGRDPPDRDQRGPARRLPHRARGPVHARSREMVRDGLAGQGIRAGDIAVVNLNQRSLVAAAGDAGEPGTPVFDRVLAELTSERFWAACEGCDLVRTCYAPHNARTFAHPSAGPKVTDRLRDLYRLVHLRGQLHITLRDLRSALAYMLTSGRDCAQIHELYRTGERDGDPRELLLQQLARRARTAPTGCCGCCASSTSRPFPIPRSTASSPPSARPRARA